MSGRSNVRVRALIGALAVCACTLAAGGGAAFSQPRPQALSWSSLGPMSVNANSGKVNAFAYLKRDPRVMYIAGGWGHTPRESPSEAGIYRTTDGGLHWYAIDNGLINTDGTISSAVNGLWIDQAKPNVLLAATEFGGTFRSTNAGNSWTNVDRAESTQFAQAGATVYVASLRGVLASTDDGATWRLVLPILGGATSVVTAGSQTLAGSAAGDIYGVTAGTWRKRGHPGTGAIHDIAIDPFRPATVYTNVDDVAAWNQNLYASLDGARTWRRIDGNWSLGAQAIAFSLVVPHRLYLGDDGSGTIFNFLADGNTQPALVQGTILGAVDMRYIIPVPGQDRSDDACYALMDQGLFFAPHCASGIAPSFDQAVRKTLTYDVAVGAAGKNLVVPSQDMGTSVSSNAGRTWTSLDNSAEGAEATVNPFNPNMCYVAHPDYGLYRSTDACATFAYVYQTAGVSSLAFLARSPAIYAITNTDLPNASVSISLNGGAVWTAANWRCTNPYQVVVSPANPSDILVATGTTTSVPQLSYSHDGGKTFHAATGLPTRSAQFAHGVVFPVHRLYAAFDPRVPTTVLVIDHDPVTDAISVYKSTNDGQTFVHASTLVEPAPPRAWPQLIVPNSGERPVHEIPYYATRFFGNRLKFNPNARPGAVPLAILTTRFGAFVSADVGTTWRRLDTSTIAHHFVGIAWDNGFVYLATFGQGILKSNIPLQ